MERREIMAARLGEMLEMLDCHAIASGSADPKQDLTFEEIMELR